ncbi:MAG: DUF2934 domain-containing protein [Rhizobiales bacterium]|nr:DUF2934 domain-containing protein [Hyphomicrobiales bacterium]
MSVHPEISHIEREERVRAIAYAIWEEEGRPDGCAEDHWLKAEQLVDAEAAPREAAVDPVQAPVTEPDWLKRDKLVAEAPMEKAPVEKRPSLEQVARRIAAARVA